MREVFHLNPCPFLSIAWSLPLHKSGLAHVRNFKIGIEAAPNRIS